MRHSDRRRSFCPQRCFVAPIRRVASSRSTRRQAHRLPVAIRAMLNLQTTLQQAVPWLSPGGRAILAALIACEGQTRPVETFARNAGFTSRHQLARILQREGLPPLEELGAWIYALGRLLDWEMSHVSLCRSVLWAGGDPGDHYRRVRHLCGVRWSEARAMGFDHLLVRFVQRCGSRDLQVEQSAG